MSIAILSRPVLVLNSNWQPLEEKDTRRAIEDLTSGGWMLNDKNQKVWRYAFHGMDITLNEDGSLADARPVTWDEWVTLPIREKDASIQAGLRAVRAPTVIITKNFSKPSVRDVKFTKRNVKKRDRYQCQYCKKFFNEDELNIDHVIPQYHDGDNSWENTVASCIPCNSKKGHKSNEEMGYVLANPPVAPKPRVERIQPRHPTWIPFIAT